MTRNLTALEREFLARRHPKKQLWVVTDEQGQRHIFDDQDDAIRFMSINPGEFTLINRLAS